MSARWRSASKRSSFGAAMRVALTIALSIEIAYLLVANVILGGWLQKWVNRDEQALKLGYASAWSPWPGRVYARDLLLRVQDTNLQFELRIASLETDIALTRLFRRTFRATHVDADGVKFKLRHKLREPAQHPAMVRALPRIESFADPPVLVDKPPEPRGKLWTIHVTGVDVRVDELWIQQFRTLDAGRASGGFRLEPTRRVSVDKGSLVLQPGPLYVGASDLIARHFGGRITTEIDMNVELLQGADVFQAISGHVRLDGELESLAFLDTLIQPAEVVIREGPGPIAIDVTLERGVLRHPSSVTYAGRRLEIDASSHRLHGDARLRLSVTPQQKGLLALSASTLSWNDTRARVPAPVIAKQPRLELETRTLALYRPFKASGGLLEIPEVSAADLRGLARREGEKLRFLGGSATGNTELRLDPDGALHGRVKLGFEQAALTLDGVRVDASGKFESRFRKPDVLGPEATLESPALAVEHGRLRTREGDTGFGWLRASSKLIPLSHFVPERATIRLAAGFPDAKPVLQALGIAPSGLAATATGVLDLSDLEFGAVLGVDRNTLDVGLESARTDAVRARGRWRRVGHRERGAFLLMTDLVNIGLELDDGRTRVRPLASESWLDRALAELDRSVRLERASPGGLRPAPARAVP